MFATKTAFQKSQRFQWLFILLVPAFMLVENIILFGWAYFFDIKIFLTATAITGLLSLLLSFLQIQVSIRMRNLIYGNKVIAKRLLLSILIYLPLTAAFIVLIITTYQILDYPSFIPRDNLYLYAFLTGVIADVIGIAINESIYFFSQYVQKSDEAEVMRKTELYNQFEKLRQQVNPHFLFNSLNSLSSLISEDQEKAESFVNEMSKVYRYVLKSNEQNLITLKGELQFIHSYFFLLQIRFSKGLTLSIDVDDQLHDYLLPPLTLQLLLENAVKHNIISATKPLQIEIYTNAESQLVIKNNLQRKSGDVSSNKIGLANIAEKYLLMGLTGFNTIEENGFFLVTLPLQKTQHEVF
jgi:sensor histidine kinase YesM